MAGRAPRSASFERQVIAFIALSFLTVGFVLGLLVGLGLDPVR